MTHGEALAIVLPHVVRWNAETNDRLYRELISDGVTPEAEVATSEVGNRLAARLVQIGTACGFPSRLRDTGVDSGDLEVLAEVAAEQWTGSFNPRPFSTPEALEVFQCAY